MGDLPDWLVPQTLPPGFQPPGVSDPFGVDPAAALAAGGYGPDPASSPYGATGSNGSVQPMGPQDRGLPPDLNIPSNQLLDPNGVPPDALTGAAPATQPTAPVQAPPAGVQQPQQPVQPTGMAPIDHVNAPTDVSANATDEAKALNDRSTNASALAGAQFDAAHAAQVRTADAWMKSADAMRDEQTDYFVQREVAHREAALENAQWAKDMDDQAKKQPDHAHWWENTSGFSKALYLAGLAFSTYGQSKVYGAKNPAAEMMMKAIDDDVQEQKDRLAHQTTALQAKGTVMRSAQSERLSDIQDTYSKKAMRLETMRQALLEQAKQPGPDDRKASLLQAAATMDQEKGKLLGKRTEQSVTEREGQLARQSEDKRAAQSVWASRANNGDSINSSNRQKAAEIKKDYDLAQLSAEEKLAGSKTAGKGDTRAVSNHTGLMLVGADGKPSGDGLVRVHKDDKGLESMASVATTANQHYADLAVVEKHIKDDSLWDIASHKDPDLVAAVTRLGYSTAKADDPGGRVNDNDFTNGVKEAIGYDPSTGIIQPLQSARNKSAMLAMIAHERSALPLRVQNIVDKYNDVDLNGHESRIAWSPTEINPPDMPNPTARGQLASQGLAKPIPVPTDVAGFRKAQKLGELDPTLASEALPKYDTDKVNALKADFKGASPNTIEAMARKALADLHGNSDNWNGPVKPATDADHVTELAIKAASEDALKTSHKAVQDAEDYLSAISTVRKQHGSDPLSSAEAVGVMKKQFGLNNLQLPEIEEILKAAKILPEK